MSSVEEKADVLEVNGPCMEMFITQLIVSSHKETLETTNLSK